MKKIIAFSDIHGNTQNLLKLVPHLETADVCLFLGDGLATLEVLPNNVNKKTYAVKGNGDVFCKKTPEEMLLEIAGKRIFMAHGHTYNVHVNTDRIQKMAIECKSVICLYGHNHKFEKKVFRGITLICVPPIGTTRTEEGGSYLEIIIDEEGKVLTEVKTIN
ncbi:MAG: YfcE family phosphodiesterase [Firmicutes bacterium]|nr:YfcE family phosphodiesterase [Bacillota bacterium]